MFPSTVSFLAETYLKYLDAYIFSATLKDFFFLLMSETDIPNTHTYESCKEKETADIFNVDQC